MKYYQCEICHNTIVVLEDSGVVPYCCQKEMKELVPLSNDVGLEKHVPLVVVKDNVVYIQVGDTKHPMTKEHQIKWVVLQTNKGLYIHYLHCNEEPNTRFYLDENEKPACVYAFCNIHSLWKKEMN